LNRAAGKNAAGMLDLSLRRRLISGIPALELFPLPEAETRPLVIIIHGLEASKETALPYAYRLAREGLHTVCFDAREHGERAIPDSRAVTPPEMRARLYDIVWATAEDIDTIIAGFAGRSRVDNERIGLVGFSMGGMIIYRYLSRGRPSGIRAAVPVIATPAFAGKLERDRSRDPVLAGRYDDDALSLVVARDPSRNLAWLKDLPLLILNGTADEHMPIDQVRDFYRRAKELYGRKDRIRMVEYEGGEHVITPAMMTETAGWLKHFL
jgi:dienelactone hydrolase